MTDLTLELQYGGSPHALHVRVDPVVGPIDVNVELFRDEFERRVPPPPEIDAAALYSRETLVAFLTVVVAAGEHAVRCVEARVPRLLELLRGTRTGNVVVVDLDAT